MHNTAKEYKQAIAICRDIFAKKLKDYGASWRIMRGAAVTDQIFIKAKRIRSIQVKGCAAVDEGILSEFIAIVNYAAIGVIQLRLGYSDRKDLPADKALELYDQVVDEAFNLMMAKNHDYDEAWRDMRILSFDDLILMKIERTKEIEDNNGSTIISEGIDANYFDMLNYSVFAIIQLTQ